MKLYYFPVSTYSQKALMAFIEKDVEVQKEVIRLQDQTEREKYLSIYPLGKVPLLELEDGYKVPESSIIVEWLDNNYDKGTKFISEDKDLARRTRCYDRMCDLYLNDSVANLLFQSWKPEDQRDQELIDKCKFRADIMYSWMQEDLKDGKWANGEDFSLADIAALPALNLANMVYSFAEKYPKVAAYFEMGKKRPSFQKVLAEAAPFYEKMMSK